MTDEVDLFKSLLFTKLFDKSPELRRTYKIALPPVIAEHVDPAMTQLLTFTKTIYQFTLPSA